MEFIEDVEKIDPAPGVSHNQGQAESVPYEMINAMLLNEFLREHRKNEEQGASIAELKKAITRLTVKDEQRVA